MRTTRRGEKAGWLAKLKDLQSTGRKPSRSFAFQTSVSFAPFIGGVKTACLSRSQNYSPTIRSRTVYIYIYISRDHNSGLMEDE